MKSSTPLFTRQNPFKAASGVEKSHYHPSRRQPMSKKEKTTALNPVPLNKRSSPQIFKQSHHPDEKQESHVATTDGQPVFEESWPTSEYESSPTSASTSSDMENSATSPDHEVQEASLLAKYTERFRRGPPSSREEQQKMDSANIKKHQPLFYKDDIQSLKNNPGVAVFSPAGEHQSDRSFSPGRGSLSFHSDTSQGELDNTEILHLQDKVERFLLRGEFTQDDESVNVSSEGLGCPDFSSPVSVDETLRRPLVPTILKSTAERVRSVSVQAASAQKSTVLPTLVPSKCPEEDILFQWRLRTKLEQARKCPQPLQYTSFHGPTFSWQAPSLMHPSANAQFYKHQRPPESSQKATYRPIAPPYSETEKAHSSCTPAFGVSGSLVSQPQAISHVPAHMHVLCDVLPCHIQSSYATKQQKTYQSNDESYIKVAHKKTQAPGQSKNTFTDEPPKEHSPSPLPASSGAKERVGSSDQKGSERNKNEKANRKVLLQKTAMPFTKRRKSRKIEGNREQVDVPDSSYQNVPNKLLPEKEQQKGSQKHPIERLNHNNAPSSSPVHSALGQVISEVLFHEGDLSPAQRTPLSAATPHPRTTNTSLPSSVPPSDAQNSMEVIAQLLQEADDSDEKEFEDDPLLQVLRKQRSWVKQQIGLTPC